MVAKSLTEGLLSVAKFLQKTPDIALRAIALAQIVAIQRSELAAKKQAIRNFTGRGDRKLSGALLNSIYSGYEKNENGIPEAYLGVRNVPYGAIHEFGSGGLPGGAITPKKANKLWIPARANAGRMTPREFINFMKAQPDRYFMTNKGAFRKDGPGTSVPLFFKVDQVKIPARPYLQPGIEAGYENFADDVERFMQSGVNKE